MLAADAKLGNFERDGVIAGPKVGYGFNERNGLSGVRLLSIGLRRTWGWEEPRYIATW